MSGSESFLSRWSRRKAQSAERREGVPDGLAPGAAEATPDGQEAALVGPPETREPIAGAFDPASLPSIELIAAGVDIRPFLQSGVPAELMRSALRSAWATDPAIRDFIGIAENQWDFNDPNAMPGFGPLTAADDSAARAAQALTSARDRFAQIADPSVSAPPAPPEASSARGDEPINKLRQKPVEGLADSDIDGLAKQQDKGNIAGGEDGAVEESGARQNHRSHGRALPR